MLYQFNLSFSLSLLFMGFLFANLFGIITSTKNIIFVFILCIELINFFVYTQNTGFFRESNGITKGNNLTKENTLTFGFLFGDSFSITFGDPLVLSEPEIKTQINKTKQKNGNIIKRKSKVTLPFKRGTSTLNLVLSYVFTILNFLKIGFEFGFFVDAFKLGS